MSHVRFQDQKRKISQHHSTLARGIAQVKPEMQTSEGHFIILLAEFCFARMRISYDHNGLQGLK
jgi:hypothetical protein